MSTTKVYPEVAESLRFTGSMSLLHLGVIHRTSNWLQDLAVQLEGLGLSVRTVEAKPESVAEVLASESGGEILCVEDLRALLNKASCADTLQRLRPVLIEARQKGWRVLLVSTVPPDLYPALAGSSILMDAGLVQGRPLEYELATDYVRSLGVTAEESITNVVRHAAGSRALLQAFASVELLSESGNSKRRSAAELERGIVRRALDEIGPLLCMWLEHWVFESGRNEIYESDIATNYLVALRSAGVLAPVEDDAFAIFPYANRTLWIEVLGEYLESVVEPPPLWAELVSELFAFEREIRVSVKRTFATTGDFEAALVPYRDRILELAQRDSVPSARDLRDVRSPLDWLTLSDLLAVAQDRARASSTGRVCGYNADDWVKLSREIVPIRNRTAHMRLARQGDLDAVRRCRRLWNRVMSRSA